MVVLVVALAALALVLVLLLVLVLVLALVLALVLGFWRRNVQLYNFWRRLTSAPSVGASVGAIDGGSCGAGRRVSVQGKHPWRRHDCKQLRGQAAATRAKIE